MREHFNFAFKFSLRQVSDSIVLHIVKEKNVDSVYSWY